MLDKYIIYYKYKIYAIRKRLSFYYFRYINIFKFIRAKQTKNKKKLTIVNFLLIFFYNLNYFCNIYKNTLLIFFDFLFKQF